MSANISYAGPSDLDTLSKIHAFHFSHDFSPGK